MRIVVDGKEVLCCSFNELKVGDVFSYGSVDIRTSSIYVKAANGQAFNLCTGLLENYNGQAIVRYEHAELVLHRRAHER